MNPSDTGMSRRTALAVLGAAGLGFWAMPSFTAGSERPEAPDLKSLLPHLSEISRNRLQDLLRRPGFSGQIPAEDVHVMSDTERNGQDGLMLGLLPLARTYSRPPISNFRVGAVARGVSGSLYLGANLEIPGQFLGSAVHAEQAALSNAYMHEEPGIAAIAVTAAPCGHCRQFMNELVSGGDIQILIEGNPAAKLSSLLPMSFGPKDLGVKEGAFPVRRVSLSLARGVSDELALAALDSAQRAYAPYTKAHSGVAVATRVGRIYRGSYIENAAFNPSLSPLQTALAAVTVAGEDHTAIAEVTLVEPEGTISQTSATEVVLSALAPSVRLRVMVAARA